MMPVGSRPSSWYLDCMQIKVLLHTLALGFGIEELGSLFGIRQPLKSGDA